jgi:hypothetical protein
MLSLPLGNKNQLTFYEFLGNLAINGAETQSRGYFIYLAAYISLKWHLS